MAPLYVVNRLEMKFIAWTKRTIFVLTFTADREKIESLCFIINIFLTPLIAFIIITFSTAILVICLNKRTKWLTAEGIQRFSFVVER